MALRQTVVSRNKESAIGTPESDVSRNIVSAMVAKATFQSQLAEGLDCCVSAKDGDIVQRSYSGRGHEIFPLIKFYLSIIKRTLSLALNRLPQMV